MDKNNHIQQLINSRKLSTNEEYELFESLEEAITACGSNECTIEMVLDTKESVNVLEGQEIKLELNGKTVTGARDYTIARRGIFKDDCNMHTRYEGCS